MRKHRRRWAIGLAALAVAVIALAQTMGTLTDLHDFDSGSSTVRGGVTLGPDGNYYGTFSKGGANGNGGIFEVAVDPNTGKSTSYTVLYSFSATSQGQNADGATPQGNLVLSLDGTQFYGVTTLGGANGQGVLFSIALPTPQNPSPAFTTLGSFGAGTLSSGFTGGFPDGHIVLGGDGTVYGVAGSGAHFNGQIWSYANGVFGDLHDFAASTGSGNGNPEGSQPRGLMLGPDGKLWGVAQSGGLNGAGTVFNVSTGGSFTLVYTYSAAPTNSAGFPVNGDGAQPLALGPASDGSGIYAITSYGGSNGLGALGFAPISGTAGLTVLGSLPGVDGSYHNSGGATPAGPPQVADDGSIYESFSFGGGNGNGAISQIMLPSPANSAATLTLNPVYTFSGLNSGVNSDGAAPGPLLFFGLGPGGYAGSSSGAAMTTAQATPAGQPDAGAGGWMQTRDPSSACGGSSSSSSGGSDNSQGAFALPTAEGGGNAAGDIISVLGYLDPKVKVKVRASFNPYLLTVAPGDSFTLTWTSKNADYCQLYEPGIGARCAPLAGTAMGTVPADATVGQRQVYTIYCQSLVFGTGFGFATVVVGNSSSSSGGSSSGSTSSSSGSSTSSGSSGGSSSSSGSSSSGSSSGSGSSGASSSGASSGSSSGGTGSGSSGGSSSSGSSSSGGGTAMIGSSGGTIALQTSGGSFVMSGTAATTTPAGAGGVLGAGQKTPYGFFNFQIAGAAPSSVVMVTITVQALSGQQIVAYEKCGSGGLCQSLKPGDPAFFGVSLVSISGNTLTLSCQTDASGNCDDPGSPVTQPVAGGGGGSAIGSVWLTPLVLLAWRRRRLRNEPRE